MSTRGRRLRMFRRNNENVLCARRKALTCGRILAVNLSGPGAAPFAEGEVDQGPVMVFFSARSTYEDRQVESAGLMTTFVNCSGRHSDLPFASGILKRKLGVGRRNTGSHHRPVSNSRYAALGGCLAMDEAVIQSATADCRGLGCGLRLAFDRQASTRRRHPKGSGQSRANAPWLQAMQESLLLGSRLAGSWTLGPEWSWS